MLYTVIFENDPTYATAAAQQVIVTQALSPNLDWSTFQLGDIRFGSVDISVPSGLQAYETEVMYTNLDGTALLVDISAGLDLQTGIVTWTFRSIDPATGLTPEDPLAGFLPPDNSSHIGEGSVEYTVQPKSSVSTGTTINQQASVVFDVNAAIKTNTAVNTIDANPPSSSVAALPATTTTPSFTVSWSGSDGAGPGIADYNVYVSDDGGAFTLFQTDTTATSATFTGQVGHAYAFYSVATDHVGLTQATPAGAQATTRIVVLPAVLQFAAAQFAANVTGGVAQVVISLRATSAASLTVTLSSPGGHDVTPLSETVTISPNVTSQIVTNPISNDGQPGESNTIIALTLSSPAPEQRSARPRPPASSSTTTTLSQPP